MSDRPGRLTCNVGVLAPLLVAALLCCMAMYVTGRDNQCAAAGGQLEFSNDRWSGEVCIRDGEAIDP